MRNALQLAKAAALAGGRVLESMRENMGQIRAKGSATDFVTEADVASGAAIVGEILRQNPDARFVIEEEEVYELVGATPGVIGQGDVWVIDPLDGTTSFIHGYPTYSVSVALVRGLDPLAGAVYNVASGEMNAAAVGFGASRDGAPITVARAATVREALVITGFPYDRGAPLDTQIEVLTAFLRAPVHGMRRDGSAAVDLCHVAAGRADGFWEYALKPWDMAAGAVICREAGALVTDVDGTLWTAKSTSVLAANRALHAEMLEVIRTAEPSCTPHPRQTALVPAAPGRAPPLAFAAYTAVSAADTTSPDAVPWSGVRATPHDNVTGARSRATLTNRERTRLARSRPARAHRRPRCWA